MHPPEPIELGTVELDGVPIRLFFTTYARAPVPAIFASSMQDGEEHPYGTLSVNLFGQGLVLPPWLISIKDRDENEDLAQASLGTGLACLTPHRWQLPFGSAAIWRLTPERHSARLVQRIAELMDWIPSGSQLVELGARSRSAQGGIVNLDIEGLSVAVRLDAQADALTMRALWFDGVNSRDLVDLEPEEVAQALESLQFNLTIDGQRIFNGMRPGLRDQERCAMALEALQALIGLERQRAREPMEHGPDPAAQASERVRAREAGGA